MLFSDTKKRKPWGLLLVLALIIASVLVLGFCQFKPTPKTVQKTIVFEAE